MNFLCFTNRLYLRFACIISYLQPVLLLVIRVFFGWLLFRAGQGKWHNVGTTDPDAMDPVVLFTKLGIPWPQFNAYLVCWTEMIGGLLLAAGLFARAAAISVIIPMVVAYLTAHKDSLKDFWNNFWQGDQSFTDQAPFPFLYTALIVLAFGPGKLSLDWILGRLVGRKLNPEDYPDAPPAN